MASSSSSSGKKAANELFQAASAGNLDLFQSILKVKEEGFSKAMQSERDSGGLTVLHHAVLGGRTELVRFLLEEGKVDVNLKDLKVGETPLHLAIMKENFPIASYLLERGADPNAATLNGRTPLHYAAEKGPKMLVETLISNGAHINAMAEGGTPLQYAAGMGQKELVKLLLAHNADPNVISQGKFCPLMASVLAKSIDCLNLLLEAGANPNICGRKGLTPIGIAAVAGETEMIKRLLRAGADPNVTDDYGMSPIEESAFRFNEDDIAILLPVTSRIPAVRKWNSRGLYDHVHANDKELIEKRKQNSKERFLFAKSKGAEAVQQKDYFGAVQWYTEALVLDPPSAAVMANRSLCWLRLNKLSHALEDGKCCAFIEPNWPKGYYRAGSAYMQLKKYGKAADFFFRGLKLDPKNTEMERALREAMDARKNTMN